MARFKSYNVKTKATFFAVMEFCLSKKAQFSMMSNKRTNPDATGDALGKKKGRPVKSKYNLSNAVNLVS
jgi:hypothetical protein